MEASAAVELDRSGPPARAIVVVPRPIRRPALAHAQHGRSSDVEGNLPAVVEDELLDRVAGRVADFDGERVGANCDAESADGTLDGITHFPEGDDGIGGSATGGE
jgi:hypothetical protein